MHVHVDIYKICNQRENERKNNNNKIVKKFQDNIFMVIGSVSHKNFELAD